MEAEVEEVSGTWGTCGDECFGANIMDLLLFFIGGIPLLTPLLFLV